VKIGVISDTHGFLDPRVGKIFADADHILHAGDIGYASIILELELIAPVTAVLGNCDDNIGYPLFQTVELNQKKFLVHHIVSPRELSDSVKTRIAKDRPDVVVFGHTHKKFAETRNDALFFNPGYAGKPRVSAERSVALLQIEDGKIRHEFITL
jgi:putative phosphoesterase